MTAKSVRISITVTQGTVVKMAALAGLLQMNRSKMIRYLVDQEIIKQQARYMATVPPNHPWIANRPDNPNFTVTGWFDQAAQDLPDESEDK